MIRLPLVFALAALFALPAYAGEGFDIVIPGRPGVPIIINGVDVSYAVVEGDFGLGKRGFFDRRPHYWSQAAIERAVQQEFADLGDDGGLRGDVHGGVALVPGTGDAETLEFL